MAPVTVRVPGAKRSSCSGRPSHSASRPDPTGNTRWASCMIRSPLGPLLDDGHHGVVVEPHRGVDPEEPGPVSVARMPGGSDSPTGRTPHERSRDPHHRSGVSVISRSPTLRVPVHAADLGEPGGVEGDPGELPVEVAGLEVGLAEPVVDGVELDAPLVGLHDHPDLLETLDHLDPDRAHRGVHPVGAQGLGGPDHPVVVTPLAPTRRRRPR